MSVIRLLILMCVTLLFGCSVVPVAHIDYEVEGSSVSHSVEKRFQSIAVLDPVVELRLHRLTNDPIVLSKRSEKLVKDEREHIYHTLMSTGLDLQYSTSSENDRFNLQRLIRNLKQAEGEEIMDVVLPVNGLLANRLVMSRPASTLLITEYKGWEKTDDLKKKESITSQLYKTITFGLVEFDKPFSSRQVIRMFQIDSASGRVLWLGRAEGAQEDTREMANQLLSKWMADRGIRRSIED